MPLLPSGRTDTDTAAAARSVAALRRPPQRGSPDIALKVVAPAKCDNAGSAGPGRVELRVAPAVHWAGAPFNNQQADCALMQFGV